MNEDTAQRLNELWHLHHVTERAIVKAARAGAPKLKTHGLNRTAAELDRLLFDLDAIEESLTMVSVELRSTSTAGLVKPRRTKRRVQHIQKEPLLNGPLAD